MGADPSTQGARVLLAWIDKGNVQGFTKREAHVALAGTFKRSSDLDEPLNVLSEHGYIRAAKAAQHGGPGRKPSPSFEVDPCRHDQHNRQNQADSGAM